MTALGLAPLYTLYTTPHTPPSRSFVEQRRSAGYLYYSPITYTSIYPLNPTHTGRLHEESRSKRPTYPYTYIRDL